MDGIKIILARCPMCGVVFPHRRKARNVSKTKTCSHHCAALIRKGSKPLCSADEIQNKSVTLDELKALEADVHAQREAMRKAGIEAKERAAKIKAAEVYANRFQVNTCAKCENSFSVLKSKVKQGSGKYCSRKCYIDYTKSDTVEDCKCINCGGKFRVTKSEKALGRGKFCSRICRDTMPSFRTGAERQPDDPATTLDGKLSFTALSDFEQAIGQLMARGYCFRTPGRAFDVNAPQSDFYGLQWGKDEQNGVFIFFYTTKPNTFKYYASR